MKRLFRLITVILAIACTIQFGLINSFATTVTDLVDKTYEQINYSSSVTNQLDDEATLRVSSVTGNAGYYARVEVIIDNNPGVAVMNLSVDYDSSVLTLVDVEDAGILGTTSHSDDLTLDPYILFWTNYNTSDDYTASGVVATLVFKIADDAVNGLYPITLAYTQDNVLNCMLEPVSFETVAGGVNVSDYRFGDVNGDGNVNALDCAVFARYLARCTGYTINEAAADMNNDTLINAVDAMILTRHVGHWEGYSSFPCEYITLTKTLNVGDTGHITDITGDMTVTKYKNENSLIVSVSEDGIYTAKQPGITYVTVIGIQKVCFVKLTVGGMSATGITLNKTYTNIALGTSEQLIATLTPADSNDTVTWISDKPTIVTVDQTGKITCIESGTVTITATTSSGKSAICTVHAGLSGTDPSIPTTRIKVGVYVCASGDLKSGTNYKANLTFSPVLSATQQATCMFALSTTNSNVVEVYNTYTGDFSKNDFTLVPGQD